MQFFSILCSSLAGLKHISLLQDITTGYCAYGSFKIQFTVYLPKGPCVIYENHGKVGEGGKQIPQALPVMGVFQVFFPQQSLFYYFGFFTSHMFCLCVTQRLVKWRNDPL